MYRGNKRARNRLRGNDHGARVAALLGIGMPLGAYVIRHDGSSVGSPGVIDWMERGVTERSTAKKWT